METAVRATSQSSVPPSTRWHEVREADGTPRPQFRKISRDLSPLSAPELRALADRMEATLREMGVTFDTSRADPWSRPQWRCDLMPQVFADADWELVVRGFRQRLRAFEAFLRDVYGQREILRAGAVPIHAVLGSPHYLHAAAGLARPRSAFLHLSGMCVTRDGRGDLRVKSHHFSHAIGLGYMMQNRRALARTMPELFQNVPVQPLAEVPLLIMERLRETASSFGEDPTVVLLSPSADSTISTGQSFLARRMGIPVVQGGDLLVLDDCVFLKTVRGLERIDVIYNRVADAWLDPLVFRRDSLLGIPGLVHCLRKGTVALVNAVGAQLADDRSLLAFAPQIIRFYLNEHPILPTVPTYWLGDIDQREMVLEDLGAYRIRPIVRGNAGASWELKIADDDDALRAEIRRAPAQFVAQPREEGAATICFEDGREVEHAQDHIVFAVRAGDGFDVFPGALTRVFSHANHADEFGIDWTSKDSWVLKDAHTAPLLPALARRTPFAALPPRQVTSRVAECFYWMGRYLERAYHQAYLISVVESLETEELNSAERRHYRPVWNRLLPPLEKSAGTSRRSITTRRDRYRLLLAPDPGSVASALLRALFNAECVLDSVSPESWATISNLRTRFHRTKFRDDIDETEAASVTRRIAEVATQLIPQFFGVCANTMLADDGWRFCEIGQMVERAVVTANSVVSIAGSLAASASTAPATEIELSAFLRLLGTRDAYRRIYQMRAEPWAVLELLWQQPEAPRSVLRCLRRCRALLRESTAQTEPVAGIESLIAKLKRIDWTGYVRAAEDEDGIETEAGGAGEATRELEPFVRSLLHETMEIHTLISDSFLSHQAQIARVSRPAEP
jgi:uncharacterized circularly permuted ATP-grasp superfamily protein/uncharacterized alpha-E superfamily protein